MDLSFNDPSLKVRGLTVKFLRSGKVVFKQEGESSHFTLHPGHVSGSIDLHKTDEVALDGEPSKHKTIGTMSKAELEEKLSVIGPHLTVELIRLVRPIRLGWIIRRRLRIGPMIPPESELERISGIRVRAGNPELAEPIKTWTKPPEFYEEVLQHPGAAFYLFDCRKHSSSPYGMLLTYRGLHGHVQMKWFKLRDLRRWAARWEPVVMEILRPLFSGANEVG